MLGLPSKPSQRLCDSTLHPEVLLRSGLLVGHTRTLGCFHVCPDFDFLSVFSDSSKVCGWLGPALASAASVPRCGGPGRVCSLFLLHLCPDVGEPRRVCSSLLLHLYLDVGEPRRVCSLLLLHLCPDVGEPRRVSCLPHPWIFWLDPWLVCGFSNRSVASSSGGRWSSQCTCGMPLPL